jgi:hypothetical protein
MSEMGFDTFNVGAELEYFLFKEHSGTDTLDEGGYFGMSALPSLPDRTLLETSHEPCTNETRPGPARPVRVHPNPATLTAATHPT